MWDKGNLWIFNAIVWWRLFELSLASMAGCTLDALKMPLSYSFLGAFFRWLIFAATLGDV
jgi:hypothetical protein